MKLLALLPFLLALPALATAQCFTGHRDAGKKLLSEKKYDAAIVRFTAAQKCSADKPANGDKEMDGLVAEAKTRKTTPPPAKPEPVPVATDPTKCDDCPEMIFVQGGSFTMGCKDSTRDGDCLDDEIPPHDVTVRDFYIGKYEVTQAEWRRVMGNNPSSFKDCDNCPVERVSWEDVQEFIRKLNAQTGKKYRLPSEAEWEYAARGGNRSQGYLYSGGNTLADVGWYDSNSGSKTKTVGTRNANELGIHDMSGNVYEWVEDNWFGDYTGAPTDDRAWVDSSMDFPCVFRGGCWRATDRLCYTACRNQCTRTGRFNAIGFRLALQL